MKHATGRALGRIEPLLAQIRKLPRLTERRPGIFYKHSSAFLHFHEDPAGIFADLKAGDGWERLPANTARERALLIGRAKALAND